MAIHSSILAWEIPCTEEPRGLQSVGLQRVQHDRATVHRHTHAWSGMTGVLIKRNLDTESGAHRREVIRC